MLSFLFWNLMGENRPERHETLRAHLNRIARLFDVDLFIFAEPFCNGADLAASVNNDVSRAYRDEPSIGQSLGVQILTRLRAGGLTEVFDSEDGRMTIRRLRADGKDMLLAVAHFPSQLHRSPDDLARYARLCAERIARAESDVGHQRTLMVGDLNLDPFDHGLVEADALHAVMTRQIARARERQLFGKMHSIFYNPMWGLFGDRTAGPPGTYYRSPDGVLAFHWHMYDQVLLRPDLMEKLHELRVLDTDGEHSLLTEAGHPRRSTASDHLPILFRLA